MTKKIKRKHNLSIINLVGDINKLLVNKKLHIDVSDKNIQITNTKNWKYTSLEVKEKYYW